MSNVQNILAEKLHQMFSPQSDVRKELTENPTAKVTISVEALLDYEVTLKEGKAQVVYGDKILSIHFVPWDSTDEEMAELKNGGYHITEEFEDDYYSRFETDDHGNMIIHTKNVH